MYPDTDIQDGNGLHLMAHRILVEFILFVKNAVFTKGETTVVVIVTMLLQ